MIDRLPTPFGLVRSGVAPDHPEVKSVQNDFTQIANDIRVSFRGNVEVGKDISLEMLRKHYNAVVLAYGSDEDRRLGLDKEDTLRHVHSARAFVNWYGLSLKHRNTFLLFFQRRVSQHSFSNDQPCIQVQRTSRLGRF